MKNRVTVFFASDDRYLPYLGTAIVSLAEHSSKSISYEIIILTTSLGEDGIEKLTSSLPENINISVCDVTERVEHLKESLSLRLRDYYSESIYYRMFIPSLFPEFERAVYLDSDLVLNDDIAKLFFTDIEDCVIGAVTDETVAAEPVFRSYVKRHIGLCSSSEYFNSGVLLMNLTAMRKEHIEERFIHLLRTYNFDTIAPDQDYLNYLCKNKVYYLPAGWNKQPVSRQESEKKLHIMHYNMFYKPWHYDNVPNGELFWKAAEKTPFLEHMVAEKESYSDEKRKKDRLGAEMLLRKAKEITEHDESLNASFGSEIIPEEII